MVYSYGNFDLASHLKFIDEQALSSFTRITPDTAVPDEIRFKEPKAVTFKYPLDPPDDDGQKCQFSLAWLCLLRQF